MFSFEDIDVISFDIFDTLLLRPFVKPTDLFRWLERDASAYGFAQERIEAERRAAFRADKSGLGEVTIDEIYSEIPQWGWMKEKELDAERALIVANPEISILYNRAKSLGKKIAIVSDMYLPRKFVENLLVRNGYDLWDYFYLSSDLRKTKHTGELFKCLIEDAAVNPNRIIHIGDNMHSDNLMPARLGIRTMSYKRPFEVFKSINPFVHAVLAKNDSLDLALGIGAVCLAWHSLKNGTSAVSYWQTIGCVVGGMFGYAYMNRVCEIAKELQLELLLFVARDGYTLEKICNMMHPEIKTKYVFAPRQVRSSSDSRVREEYKAYIYSLGITESRIGVVDTTSLKFSGQKLLAEYIGKDIFGFYTVALALPCPGWCMLYSPNATLGFMNLIEFLYSAPHPPVASVKAGTPVYFHTSQQEKKRMEVCPEISRAELLAVEMLLKTKPVLTPTDICDFLDSFIENVSNADYKRFNEVAHSIDVSHTNIVPVIKQSVHARKWHFYKKALPYRRHAFRSGLQMIYEDYLFGLIRFRTKVTSL